MASRRDFFSSFGKAIQGKEEVQSPLLRPPYALDESAFDGCLACESKACQSSCDEGIIEMKEGMPIVDFSKSGCTFCEECAMACPEEVLSLTNLHTANNLNARIRISTQDCVAHHGVICFSCKEPCIDDAILFNGMFNPVIDMDKCTACGFCIQRCPAFAIEVMALPLAKESA